MTTETKYPPLPKLKKWIEGVTPAIAKRLAEIADTSDSMFRQWIPGRRGISADMAGRLEAAMRLIKSKNPEVPDPLTRGDLCEACRECPYFQEGQAKKKKEKKTDKEYNNGFDI